MLLQVAPDGCVCVEASLMVQRDPAAKVPDTGFGQPYSEAAPDKAGPKQGQSAQPQKLPPSVWRAMSGLAGGTPSQVLPCIGLDFIQHDTSFLMGQSLHCRPGSHGLKRRGPRVRPGLASLHEAAVRHMHAAQVSSLPLSGPDAAGIQRTPKQFASSHISTVISNSIQLCHDHTNQVSWSAGQGASKAASCPPNSCKAAQER